MTPITPLRSLMALLALPFVSLAQKLDTLLDTAVSNPVRLTALRGKKHLRF